MTTDTFAGFSQVCVDTQASAISQGSAYSCKRVVADCVVSTVVPYSAKRTLRTIANSLPGCSSLQQ